MSESIASASLTNPDRTDADAPLSVDFEAASKRLDGDPTLLNGMLGFFDSQVPTLASELDAALQSGERHATERAAHSIKSQCMTFDVQPCAALMQQLEIYAKSDDLDSVRRFWPEAKSRLLEAVEHLRGFRI